MSNLLTELTIQNYRALADVTLQTGRLNVLFGPNGAGKSTFLDTIWFVRDCAIRGVDLASSERSHGIGILWDGAPDDQAITIALSTAEVRYELSFALSSGRIDPFVGERLRSLATQKDLIVRSIGSEKVSFHRDGTEEPVRVTLREPDKLSLSRYLDFNENAKAVADLDRLLRYVHMHHARSFDLHALKRKGSEASHETWLWGRGGNAWSVLRNLQARKHLDMRYDTIMAFMRKALPGFDDLLLEQTGATSVTGSFLEKGRRKPILASGVSDGHLELLLLLTALFGEGRERDSLILLDEPEISLHPAPLGVLAEALQLAVNDWNKQVFVATHSPVLISQFAPERILVAAVEQGATRFTRVSEIPGIQDLLEQYAAGSLYMAGVLAPQAGGLLDAAATDEAPGATGE